MSTTNSAVPVVFIHGLWLHATSWEPWVTLFAEAGHAPIAPGWPGEPATVAAARANPSAVAGRGIAAVADHYAGVIADLPAKPILVGHSFGGLIAQILLCRGLARAAIALDPAPFRGVLTLPMSALKVASVAVRNPLNRGRALSLTRQQWGYGFANALPDAEALDLFELLTVPSPARPLFEAAAANLNPATPARVRTTYATRGPLLITAADQDHAVPAALSRGALRQYANSTGYVELHEFTGRGHSLVIDHGWREVADLTLSWIDEHVLPSHQRPPSAPLGDIPALSGEAAAVGAGEGESSRSEVSEPALGFAAGAAAAGLGGGVAVASPASAELAVGGSAVAEAVTASPTGSAAAKPLSPGSEPADPEPVESVPADPQPGRADAEPAEPATVDSAPEPAEPASREAPTVDVVTVDDVPPGGTKIPTDGTPESPQDAAPDVRPSAGKDATAAVGESSGAQAAAAVPPENKEPQVGSLAGQPGAPSAEGNREEDVAGA